MSDDDWKQSAVMFYAFGTILTVISFISCCVYSLYKNADRKRNVQKICCFCCIKDPMQNYDTIPRNDDDPNIGKGLVEMEEASNAFSITGESDDEEIDVNIHSDDDEPEMMDANQFNLSHNNNDAI